ncbi:MAG: CBS domain-containing protein [Chloroflexi bacterium]|nr:CBS domain-containing protein [Chloroflexota bacterium]
MTSEPVTIDSETTVPEAHNILKENNFRRLPVVVDDKLVGIITRGDLREAGPSDATSLSIYELKYLIAMLKISEIMTPSPIVVSTETTLYDAAKLMLENKIGGLPVVDGDNVVGITTESDLFRALIEITESK